jgi:membrane protease YdiL (CAAX protease family)
MKSYLSSNFSKYVSQPVELKPTIILLISALFLTIHKYFGSIEFAKTNFNFTNSSAPAIFMFLTAFILLGVIPFFVIKYIFKEKFQNYGLILGDWQFGLRSVAVLFPLILILLLFPASQTAEMRNFYPFDKSINSFSFHFIWFQFLRAVFYYSVWEFFFRGFMLFGLRKYVGDWLAICIQVIPQCLWHIGMPSGEIFSSIAGGILFGLIALRTNSILWPLLLHFLIGFGMDFFIVIT